MRKKMAGAAFCIVAFAISAVAQTEIQSLGTNAGFRVASGTGDDVNEAPWYGMGLSNLSLWAGQSNVVQVAGYWGLNFQTAQGQIVIRGDNGNVGIGTTSPAGQLSNNSINYGEFGSGGSAGSFNWVHTATDSGWNAISSAGTNGLVVATDQTSGIPFQVSSGAYNTNTGLRANHLFTILGIGNVGVGTTTPGAKLEVDGSVLLTSGSGASMTYADGTVQSTAWNGTTLGGDYAESVDVSGDRTKYEPGDLMVADPAVPGKFLRSATPYSTMVAGVYSTRPGLVGRRQLTDRSNIKNEVPMAMTGIVPTKVTAENGAIKVGDLLVTSSKLGYAMKGTDRSQMLGAVVGKALAPLGSGTGVIEVLVTLQ